MILNSKSIFSGFSYNNYIIIITFKIKYTFNMITISNKSNITFLSFRKIKLNIIYTMFILSKNISITRVFLIIIILRFRIRITIDKSYLTQNFIVMTHKFFFCLIIFLLYIIFVIGNFI